MKEIKGSFIGRIKRTHDVESFRFKLEEKIEFLPGQFVQVIFDESNKLNKDLNKILSFSCAPGKKYIEVTKKISDSKFSKCLMKLNQGAGVLFKCPMGKCVFESRYPKIGFLVGGIGITPVISILDNIADKQFKTDVCLLYSNWTEKDIAFKDELNRWKESNNARVIYTLVKENANTKQYCSGIIDKEFIKTHMQDYSQRVLFIFGPLSMVDAMKNICLELGCKEEIIKTESFMGY